MMKKKRLEIPNDMGVGTMAWGDEAAGFVSDPKYRPKDGEFNPADIQVGSGTGGRWSGYIFRAGNFFFLN